MQPALVTVVIPARNEAGDIAAAIESVGQQAFDLSRIEVVVVDGASDDETAEVAKRSFDRFGFRRAEVVNNTERRTPSNLNRGLLWAEGDVIVRVDARSRIPSNYINRIVDKLGVAADVAVVGGRQVAVAPAETVKSRGIARALNNSLAMGLSRYRRKGAASGNVDTVYLGAFRTDQLRDLGGWNEDFASNQDFELNRRMANVGSVWFDASLAVAYIPRATIGELLSQYHRFGRWKVAYWKQTQDRPQGRQLLLLAIPVVGGGASGWVAVTFGWRALAVLIGGGASLAATIDHVGSGRCPAPIAVRAYAISANAAVSTGWFSGVVRGLIRDDAMQRRVR